MSTYKGVFCGNTKGNRVYTTQGNEKEEKTCFTRYRLILMLQKLQQFDIESKRIKYTPIMK